MSKKNWSTRLAFIVTTSAFAVGLGNIWRFPYIAGEGGGGAFLLVYIILILLIGIPIMLSEIALGRMAQTTPMVGYGKLSENNKWNGIGWLGITASLLIMSYYVMILAWIVYYIWESFSGNIALVETQDLSEHFDTVASDLHTIIFVVLIIMVSATLIVRQGLKAGLEMYSKWMMIVLILMLIALTIWSSTLDSALEGYRWFLYPDFSKINLEVIISALGQLFFSIGVGMTISFAFGSYTSYKENLVTSTAWIVLTDTIFAILAGLLIFPAIFSFGLSPESGPNLIFVTMATVFSTIELGTWLGSIFFLLLFFAGFTSLISAIQGIKDSFVDKFHISDTKALLSAAGIITLVSVPVVFSYSEDPILFFGMTTFGLLDYLTNTIMLPLGGLLIAVFAGHVIGFAKLKKQINIGAENIAIGDYWQPILKYIIPLAILVILINGII